MSRVHSVRRSVLCQAISAVLLATGVSAASAMPMQETSTSAAQQPASFQVDFPAQSLRSALDQFALQTGLQVVYAGTDILAGRDAPAVSGNLPADVIVQRLLEGSGLRYRFVNSHTVSISKAPDTAPAAPPAKDSGSQKMRAGEQPQIHITSDRITDVTDLEVVMVTGTNLSDVDPASPMVIIDAEQIEMGGYSSVEDALRHLPQNFSSRTSYSAAMGETEYGDSYLPKSPIGNSSVNLRGLGSRSTLILVNGHRVAGSAQGQGAFTDISSIPLSQIERIEVLTDGASAIYGADAVAGVVNIVLKKSYAGTVVHARHENSSSGADASRLDFAHTVRWGSGYLTAAGSLRKKRSADMRQFIRVGPAGVGDFSNEGGVNSRLQGIGEPGVVYEVIDLGYGLYDQGAPIGMIPTGQNGTALSPNDLLPYDPTQLPSVRWSQHLGPEVTTPSLRINGEQQLGQDLLLTYGGSYTRQRNKASWQPQGFDFNFMQAGSLTLVPESNVHNPFGRDVLVGYSYAREFQGMTMTQEQRQTNSNYNLGLSGRLPWTENWKFDVTWNDSRERGRSDQLVGMGGVMGFGSDPAITDFMNHINVFGDASDPAVVAANRKLISALVDRYKSRFSSHLRDLDLLVRGNVFALPGGDAQLAIGAQARDERYHMTNNFGGHSVADAKRKVPAGYAELGLPLLSDVAGAKQLTLTLAARYETFRQHGTTSLVNYAFDFGADPTDLIDLVELGGFDVDKLTGAAPGAPNEEGPMTPLSRRYSNTSHQVSLAWKPVDALRLRATWGQSFLTPDALQQFGQDTLNIGTYAVQFNGGSIPPGVSNIVQLTGPNPNLEPQTATVRTFGFDYLPEFLPGLMVSATYNDTRFDNYIGDPLAGLSYAEIFSDISKMPPETFTMGDNGVLLWDAREVNFLGRRSRTVDTNIDYNFDNAWGDWAINLKAVRTLELSAHSLPAFPAVTFSDSEFGPSKWVGDLLLTWRQGGWMASGGMHYSSPFRVLFPMSAEPNVFNDFQPGNLHPRRHAGSYTTADFQLGYRWRDGAGWLAGSTVRLGVKNAFNKAFPFVDNQFGFLSNRVNPRGRVIYLDLKKTF